MPVYNEIKTIREILKRVSAVKIDKEIIIVDDFSTDGTRKFLKKIKDKNIKIVFHKRNHGKGYAIRTGLRYAKGDLTIIQDADLEYDPEDYLKLIKPIKKGASVVYGSRRLNKKNKQLITRFYIATDVLNLITNLLYNAKITDEPTCYKLFKTKLLRSLNLKCKRFEFCPEVTAKVRKRGYKIHEVPIYYKPRTVKEGKKIGWRDGFEAVWTLIKYRFSG